MLGGRRGQGAHRCCPAGQQAGGQPPPAARGRGSGAWAVREQWEAMQVSEERTWFRAERGQLRVATEWRGKATPDGGCRGSGQRQLGDAGGLGAHRASFFPKTPADPRHCPGELDRTPQDIPTTDTSISTLSCREGTEAQSPPARRGGWAAWQGPRCQRGGRLGSGG